MIVSRVSGQRVSFTSMPSRSARQPVAPANAAAELLQLGLRRPDDVAPSPLAQPGEIGRARHAAVADPHPPDHPVTGLHRGHNRLQRARVVHVAGKHFVAEREAIEAHHQRDAHLFAVGPVIARVAALRERVRLGLALEEGAGHVVEQHLVVDRKKLPAAARQMRFQRPLVLEQLIQGPIQPVLVDLRIVQLQ